MTEPAATRESQPTASFGPLTIVAALALAVAAGLATALALDNHQRLVAGLGAAAVLVLALGIALASTRVAAVATPIAMAAAAIGSWEASTIAWGWTIALGCGWYVAFELAITVIERRGSLRHTRAVAIRRQWEIAVVVAVAATFALVSFVLATIAPERDLTARVAGVVVVLAAMIVVHRRSTG